MKLLKTSMLLAIMLGSIVAATAQTADDIMDNHLKAIGPKEAWTSLKTLRMEGTMSVQGQDIPITETMALGKAMRVDITAMGMAGYNIVTKTEGWTYMPFMGQTKPEAMKPEMVKTAQAQLNIKGKEMFDYKTNGTKIEYLGKDTLDKVLCYKIKSIDKDGNESVSYFDANTYYLLRTEAKVKVDDQEQEGAMTYANYKKLDNGILMPMTIGTPQGDITFKTIEVNKPIDDSLFKPGDEKTTK